VDVPSAFTSSLPTNGSAAALVASLPTAPGSEGTLAGIAGHLGLSPESLQAALRDGQSIAGLAEQQGVSRESIATFVGSQIQRARQLSGQVQLDQDALERTVDRALDRKRPQEAGASTQPSVETLATATYANNARTAPTPAPPGGTISLLA
jgi:lambda repressor-like predicted transcriptional regulator